ncbi:MAG: response regulator [Gammaproteobacteria bacterium]|nr:response regulator [Gammaproteobacteria bacterium]MDH3506992.1 response regulator [Gammaproteobacteria bacterium]
MKTILVVDDQPELRQLVSLSLGETNFRIRHAENGEGALVQARIEVPDLVVLDLMMPGSLDGFGVCWELKTDPRFQRTKVLILSGQAIKGSHRVCEQFGADAFLPKPFSPSELAARVEHLLCDNSDVDSTVRKRVLIVDDRPELRSLISLTLGASSYEIAEAGNGKDAIELARTFRPHVLVLDVVMPGELSGHDVCLAVKSDPALEGTQVVMLTARAEQGDRKAAARLGADDYLVKPFSPLELIDRIGRLLDPAYHINTECA